MKTFVKASLALSLLILVSCTRSSFDLVAPEAAMNNSPQLAGLPLPGQMSYCGEKIVPLCAGQNINIGTVTVVTDSEDKVHITYKTTGAWYLKKLHLYAGPQSGIPTNNAGNPQPGHFPYKVTFTAPYTVQEYTFVISNLPASFVVAAHAEVVKMGGVMGTQVLQMETAWGDGCSGTQINGGNSGNWATYFTYNKVSCAILPEICSYPVNFYFDSLINGMPIPWMDVNGYGMSNGNVTVSGFNYSEAEGRAIYQTPNPNNIEPVSKRAFANICTMKLCGTNYFQDPILLQAVTVTETWLATLGKLSSTNLPTTTNLATIANVNYLSSWIENNRCPDR